MSECDECEWERINEMTDTIYKDDDKTRSNDDINLIKRMMNGNNVRTTLEITNRIRKQ